MEWLFKAERTMHPSTYGERRVLRQTNSYFGRYIYIYIIMFLYISLLKRTPVGKIKAIENKSKKH